MIPSGKQNTFTWWQKQENRYMVYGAGAVLIVFLLALLWPMIGGF